MSLQLVLMVNLMVRLVQNKAMILKSFCFLKNWSKAPNIKKVLLTQIGNWYVFRLDWTITNNLFCEGCFLLEKKTHKSRFNKTFLKPSGI